MLLITISFTSRGEQIAAAGYMWPAKSFSVDRGSMQETNVTSIFSSNTPQQMSVLRQTWSETYFHFHRNCSLHGYAKLFCAPSLFSFHSFILRSN